MAKIIYYELEFFPKRHWKHSLFCRGKSETYYPSKYPSCGFHSLVSDVYDRARRRFGKFIWSSVEIKCC